MADIKITDLPLGTDIADDDELLYVDVSDQTAGPDGTDKRVLIGSLRNIVERNTTTEDLIASDLSSFAVGKSITTVGFYESGDGGGAQWVKTADTDTPSQTPAQLGDAKFTDSDGFVWELVVDDSEYYIKKLGAKIDGSTDDIQSIKAAVFAASQSTPNHSVTASAGKVLISETLYIPAQVHVDFKCRIENAGGIADRSFIGVYIQNGNGVRKVFNNISGFSDGLVVEGSVHDIVFNNLSYNDKGLVIFANEDSNLDNRISGVQIGQGGIDSVGIEFRQNGIKTQQGNEVRVNFISNIQHALNFNDEGTHTEASNWDSNYVELIAYDPFYLVGATTVWNQTNYSVSNISFHIKSWFGGFNVGDGTMTIIKGGFLASDFIMNAATSFDSSMFDNRNYSSCKISTVRKSLSSSETVATTSTDKSLFNGGVELSSTSNIVNYTTQSAISAGGRVSVNVWHALSCGSSKSGNFTADLFSGSGFNCNAIDVPNEQKGLVRIYLTNISNSTIPIGENVRICLRTV